MDKYATFWLRFMSFGAALIGSGFLWSAAGWQAVAGVYFALWAYGGYQRALRLGPGGWGRSLTEGVCIACLLGGGLPAIASAQTDSVTVTVVDRTNLTLRITTTRLTGEVGDTVTFEAIAFDTITGDTVAVIVGWTSNSAVVEIDPDTGFATFLGGCGQTVCTAQVFADLASVLVGGVVFGEYPEGWRELYDPGRAAIYAARGYEPERHTLEVGQTRQLCLYFVSAAGYWFRSSEACPSCPGAPVVCPPAPLPIDPRLRALG